MLLVNYDFVVVFESILILFCDSRQALLVDHLVVHDLRLPVILLGMVAGGVQDALLRLQEVLVVALGSIVRRVIV